MSGKKGMTHYPIGVQLEAIRMFFEEGKTHGEITKVLGIRDPQRTDKWIRAYRQRGVGAFVQTKRPGRRPKKENSQTYLARLEMENALLKKFHTELRELRLAQRNIGRSTTTERTTR